MEGSEEHLNESSQDMVTLRRVALCTGIPSAMEEYSPCVKMALARLEEDKTQACIALNTIDPAVFLPALWRAWNQPGARASHATTSSEEWIETNLTLVSSDLVPTKFPYGRASMCLQLTRHGVKGGPDGFGPQIDPNGAPKAPADEQERFTIQEAWKTRVASRRALALAEEAAGKVVYWFDSTRHRSISCTNNLANFHPYSAKQTTGLGLNSPIPDKAPEHRMYFGCVRLLLNNGEFYVHHGVVYNPHFSITSSSRMRLFCGRDLASREASCCALAAPRTPCPPSTLRKVLDSSTIRLCGLGCSALR